MSPVLEIPRCCVLPPVPTCRGVRPSQAANCRPDLKVDRSVAVATNAGAFVNWKPVRVVHLNPDQKHDQKQDRKEFKKAA